MEIFKNFKAKAMHGNHINANIHLYLSLHGICNERFVREVIPAFKHATLQRFDACTNCNYPSSITYHVLVRTDGYGTENNFLLYQNYILYSF